MWEPNSGHLVVTEDFGIYTGNAARTNLLWGLPAQERKVQAQASRWPVDCPLRVSAVNIILIGFILWAVLPMQPLPHRRRAFWEREIISIRVFS